MADVTGSKILNLDKKTAVYTKCYCEENVWKLCEEVRNVEPDQLDHCYCVFISNTKRMIPLWCQCASQAEDGIVIWDYHVILIHSAPGNISYVYDLDTTLPFPSKFEDYLVQGIRPNISLKMDFHRMFRVIPALEFLGSFASDRSHMLTENGQWSMSPPSYPCIETTDSKNNIQEFISMDEEYKHGEVLDYDRFSSKFLKLM